MDIREHAKKTLRGAGHNVHEVYAVQHDDTEYGDIVLYTAPGIDGRPVCRTARFTASQGSGMDKSWKTSVSVFDELGW